MQIIDSDAFHALVEHLARRAPDLVTTCRWLACGPEMASSILGEDVPLPTASDLGRLAAALDSAPVGAAGAGRDLIATYSPFVAEVEVALERLLAAGDADWSHPTEILGRPCPGFSQLLAGCRARLRHARSAGRRRLERVAAKLKRAARIEAAAHRRLEAAA